MVNAQEWLDKEYPLEKRSEIKELNISYDELYKQGLLTKNEHLEGSLDIRHFPSLEKFDCKNNRLTSLTLTSLYKLMSVDCSDNQINDISTELCMVLNELMFHNNPLKSLDISNCDCLDKRKITWTCNAQEWLDENYPKRERKNVVSLNIPALFLEGSLDLSDFINLEILNCDENRITNFNTSKCYKLAVKEITDQLSTFLFHPDFTAKLQAEWENIGLDYQQTKEWIEMGLSPKDYEFAYWLKKKGWSSSKVCSQGNIEKLREEFFFYTWRDLFTDSMLEHDLLDVLAYKKQWENEGFTHEETKQWMENGDLNHQNTYLAAYARDKGHKPGEAVDYNELQSEYLDKNSKENSDVVKIVSKLPLWTVVEKKGKEEIWKGKGKLDENYSVTKEINYGKIYPEIPRNAGKNKNLTIKQLPIKLYNVKKDEVEWTKNSSNIKNYAILSYVWGKPGTVDNNFTWNTQYKKKLNPAGYKSLYKAVQACKKLGVDYLWMDQLCIDQNDIEEKKQEVPKMRQYYNNSEATFISIQTDIDEKIFEKWHRGFERGKNWFVIGNNNPVHNSINIISMIIRSEWFSRSWTFQEGWLSKHTVFMFDNYLIDGRFLSLVWESLQGFHWVSARDGSLDTFSEKCGKTATPIGWTYYKNGYNSEDTVALTLNEALKAVRNRGKGVTLDGIYSILGLLTYGDDEEIKINYKPRICLNCPNREEIRGGCQHSEEEKKWPVYTKKELEDALLNIMKVAVKNGYGEPLAWLGIRDEEDGSSWLPKIDEKSGTVIVEGGIKIHCEPGSINFAEKGVEIIGSEYIISAVENSGEIDVRTREMENAIEFCNRKVWVKFKDNYKKLTLNGTLERIEVGDSLIVFNEEEIKNEKKMTLALLTSLTEEGTYKRKGLVALLGEDLEEIPKKKITIGLNAQQETDSFQKQQTQIQIPPK